MSDTPDMVPSALPTALWTNDSDFAMIDSLDFETPIMSIQLRYGPTISTTGTTSHARIVPTTSLETVNTTYLTSTSDLVILAIQPSDMAPIASRGHIDAGALASTTHLEETLHDLQLYDISHPCPIRLVTADNERFAPKGAGYLHVPTGEIFQDYHRLLCFWCPQIPNCILSPHSFEALHDSGKCTGFDLKKRNIDNTCTLVSTSSLGPTHDLVLDGVVINNLCYSPELIMPTSNPPSFQIDTPIRALNAAATRQLWHQRLGHIGDDKLYAAHHHIQGIPRFPTKDGTLDKCPICLQAKLRKRARTKDSTRKATAPFQGIAMDFGFIVQKSANVSRLNRFTGINGETCYILAVCHFCNELEGSARVSKQPPITWIRAYLNRNSNPNLKDKYVLLDQGGELYNCKQITDLFAEYDYTVYPTGAMSSWQNGVVEKPHQWIGDTIRAMLTGSALDPKFWPYCFRHSLRIKNAFPVSGFPKSAYETRTGKKPNFTQLRTIGCRVLVKPSDARIAKPANHVSSGIYLGPMEYTLKNIQWYDPETLRIKIAYHCKFDEGFSDLPLKKLPPNVLHLQRMQQGSLDDLHDSTDITTPDFDISLTPFTADTKDLKMSISCEHSTFGFILQQDVWTDRPYLSDFEYNSSASHLAPARSLRKRYQGALLLAIDDTPVYNTDEAKRAFLTFRSTQPTARTLAITIATVPLPSQQERRRIELEENLGRSHAAQSAHAAATTRAQMAATHTVPDVQPLPPPNPVVSDVPTTDPTPILAPPSTLVPLPPVMPPARDMHPAILPHDPSDLFFDPLLEPPPLIPRTPDPLPVSSDPLPVSHAPLPVSSRTRAAPQRPASLVTDVKIAPDFPTQPVYWNKALPPSTEEPTISIADLRQIHFIRTGTYISEDDLPSSLLSTAMLTSRQFYHDDLPSPASTPPSELPVHQTALTPVDVDFAISAISSDKLTEEEIALGPKLSRRALLKLQTWPRWQAAEWKQLDQFHTLGMFGTPCRPPPDATVMRFHWAYKQKEDGTYRSRACGDGSRRALPRLYDLLDTYHSCLASPIYRMHLALCAVNGLVNYGADVVDAYAHSDGPSSPCYLYVDSAYRDWWHNKTGEFLAPGLVLPLQRALQGHPEAGKSYEKKIVSILDSLGFQSTIHERNIYRGTINGELVLVARQIDDFAIGTKRKSTAEELCRLLGVKLKHPNEAKAPIKFLGLLDKFIGTDVLQTRHYTKLSCTSYIERMLTSHGWDKPSPTEHVTTSRPIEPLSSAKVEEIYRTVGPAESTSQHRALEKEMKFPYRGLLGELLYAYVTARPDIGYAVTTLSKFATNPDKIHYLALKRLAIYLRQTITWGIIYWRKVPCSTLPDVPISAVTWDSSEPFDVDLPYDQLLGFVDSAHATDLRNRRSTTGYAFCLAGGAIAWRASTQSVVATSSTEGEFIAAVSAAKTAKYLRSVLTQLDFAPIGPTILFEDNASAIRMVNSNRPTERSRHIDIAWFAIQDWRAADEIVLKHIKGTINPSDDLTKALGWILHARHSRRLLGHYRPKTLS